jgi:diaminohydroxyphosphoribosylaminopyrimidine deaminase/5-amino-6-(5-phosphoribosylamino)uracil reductase
MTFSAADSRCMLRALELAERGRGSVEPNPLVGCTIVQGEEAVGEGWHGYFGGPHAEIEALAAAQERARGGTLYVTLEPCCHYGQTPPCVDAIVPAGIRRVVIAMRDPFPRVAGGGIKQLQAAGIAVEVGLQEAAARELNAPYLKLLATGKPWVIAKWAMTLDGKIATRSGYSKWISSAESRGIVHELRGRVDAIVVGRRTAEIDDPLLTARPEEAAAAAGDASGGVKRVATRVVVDSLGRLSLNSQLVKTARQTPLLIACGPEADSKQIQPLLAAGCEVLPFAAATRHERLLQLLEEFGRRRMTNILVEGGAALFGELLDARQIDELHVFMAPKLFGGQRAPSPIAGAGVDQVSAALSLSTLEIQQLGGDIYLRGRV